ncbi:MAG: hypothetical protein JXA62_07895, partial [Candidatus Aminicenantes bacterium]|nr:hypothetical protein [Candidatus Aminicenantes bacterium]
MNKKGIKWQEGRRGRVTTRPEQKQLESWKVGEEAQVKSRKCKVESKVSENLSPVSCHLSPFFNFFPFQLFNFST